MEISRSLAWCSWIFILCVIDVSSEEGSKAHKLWFHPSATKEIQSCLSEDLEQEFQGSCRFFAAVIDAGSTGTRLHLFEFSHDIEQEHSPFKLEKETFKEELRKSKLDCKPGLSSFAQTPELAAESVRELLSTAKQVIPTNLWVHTPITLKATAGLRLLPENQADAILSQAQLEVASSGLLLEDDESVGMLSGIDEGVFGWFTLNYLLGRLSNGFESGLSTAAALDLGGGSTQVTFLPDNLAAALELYTHSYLGNGLVAARIGVAQLSSQSNDESHSLFTSCFPRKFQINDWDYAGNVWVVSATQEASFEACLSSTIHYVESVSKVVPIPQLADNDVFVFSYFYDRGLQAGLVQGDSEQSGGFAKVVDYKQAAQKACSIPAEEIGPEHWKPWQCLDLTYIYTLLHFGYGLPDQKSIHLTKKLKEKSKRISLKSVNNNLKSETQKNIRVSPSQQKHMNTTSNHSGGYIQQLMHYISDAATHVLVYLKLAS
uniref:Uncharacterized protein n=1 Tax=Ditylenchus dipsaci TaxID=166011 RepID=A0A915EE67_9BILA